MPKRVETEAQPKIEKFPSGKSISPLINRVKKLQDEGKVLSKAINEEIVGTKNVHKGALRAVMAVEKMPPNKAASFLAHFDFYLDKSGVRDRAGMQAQMFDSEDDPSEEADVVDAASPTLPDDKRDFRPRSLRTGSGATGQDIDDAIRADETSKANVTQLAPRKRTTKDAADKAEAQTNDKTKLH